MKNKEEILNEIMKTNKYNKISKEIINRIIDSEFDKYKNNKIVIKEVKNKLHQIHGIFLEKDANGKVLHLLEEDRYDEILKLHMSTLERLAFYSEFYEKIFTVTGLPTTILDLACGYNPFALKYMNLGENFKYYAYDINEDTNELINLFFKKNNYNGVSKTIDLAVNIPLDVVDIAFILKFLPLVEQQNKKFSRKLLLSLSAKYIVVSFPTKTVSGKSVGMLNNYRDIFGSIIADDFVLVSELIFVNEMVFIIKSKIEE